MIMLKKLPIGIQTIDKLILGNYLYIDKTKMIYELLETGSTYFLSRPRRFGKSLLISTLEQIFVGNKELFKGLWIYDQPFAWEKHAVIRISFSGRKYENEQVLVDYIYLQLKKYADEYGITLKTIRYEDQFNELLRKLSKDRKVVVLIDEYDKPILDVIDNVELAKANRDTLKAFYSVIKESDEYLRFVLLTGVTKFSKVSVFSGMNNLNDISMNKRYSTLLGYTQDELEYYFKERIEPLSEVCGKSVADILMDIKLWYNGYRFGIDVTSVYNPFSTLLLFDNQAFSNYWFETGTPTFLVKLMRENNYELANLEEQNFEKYTFDSYEIERLQPTALLYQTGYLTIKSYDTETEFYRLGYPNHEVKKSLSTYLLDAYSGVQKDYSGSYIYQLITALKVFDNETFFETLRIFFADIPYDIQIKQEKYYQTIFYLVFTLIGMRIEAEVRTNKGRIDAVMIVGDVVHIFEFKLKGTAIEALEQIKTNNYYEKYMHKDRKIKMYGVAFDPAEKNIGEWIVKDFESLEYPV